LNGNPLAQIDVYGKGNLHQKMTKDALRMNVSDAVAARRSVRGYRDQPVDMDLVQDIVKRAARAATGGNLQPWHIDIVHGASMARLKTIMADIIANRPGGEAPEYDIYPKVLPTLYKDRRFAVGEELYARLGIPREDKMARLMWFARNFQFFGAPVALFCTVDRNMGPPQWSDLGMYLQNVMLLCAEAGLATCAQECWAVYPQTIRAFLGTPDERMLFTGMSIGYEDPADPANAVRASRAPSQEWLSVHD
jgi:nitroreductase